MDNSRMVSMLKELVCPVCKDYMVEEIALCKKGHSLCKECKDNSTICPTCNETFVLDRSVTLEKIASICKYTCKHDGCDKLFDAKEIKQHQLICGFAIKPCVLNFTGCTWSGKISTLKHHIEARHPNHIGNWKEYNYKLNNEKDSKICESFVLFYEQETFVVFGEYSTNTASYSAMYAGVKRKAEDYTLCMHFVDQTGKQFKLNTATPCIPKCGIEAVSNSDKITVAKDMLKNCFQNKSGKIIINTFITEMQKNKYIKNDNCYISNER